MDSKITDEANRRMEEKQKKEQEQIQQQTNSNLARYKMIKNNRKNDAIMMMQSSHNNNDDVNRTISKDIINGIEQSIANSSLNGSVHNQSSSDMPQNFADKKQ